MSATHRLNVFDRDAHGSPCHEVWLDCEDMDFTGICLGSGDTTRVALMDAKEELEHALDRVNAQLQRLEQANGSGRSHWEETEQHEGERMMRIFRQGDVLIATTTKQPSAQAKPVTDKGRTILAYGEVTGHAHEVIATPGVDPVPAQQLFEEPDGTRLLVLRRDAELRHEEHHTIPLPAGTYEIRRQMEYAPGALRNVAD